MKRFTAWLALAGLLATAAVGASSPGTSLTLPDASTVTVDASGLARVWSSDRSTVTYRRLTPELIGRERFGGSFSLPSKSEMLEQLDRAPGKAFARDEVIVAFRPGVGAIQRTIALQPAALAQARRQQLVPSYTNDIQVNRALARLGADRSVRFADDAYRVHITAASVRSAVTTLAKLPSVSYVSPNWYVGTMRAPGIQLPRATIQRAQNAARSMGFLRTSVQSVSLTRHDVPTNYAVSASAQSLLNAPGVNAVGAFDEISERFHQLPGQGEIVTNVSLGDLDDVSALPTGPSPTPRAARGGGGGGKGGDPCAGPVSYYGPTTEMIGGQRYIDWPSMPLIPTYVADDSGNLSGSAEVCNSSDPTLGEIGLDFSVMAPLPHNLQRPQNQGSGFTDLLGIAPGAQYRLVVPGNPDATVADIDAALLAAANQYPRPNVITASLGIGLDSMGFPGRYIGDDPITNQIVTSIVRRDNIVVCIAANDGLRLYTNAAIPPSGGSAATDVVKPGQTPSDLNDIALSTAPSLDSDSGALDVGGTTLDDIFSAPPQDPHNAALASQHAFPVTRYNGMTEFSSGFGSRVDVSAPADNIPAVQHAFGGPATAVDVYLEAGTSASAPETAAAAAVALQVARLTGHPFQNALEVRAFLRATGRPVPNAPQSDASLHVGPQIDLTNVVETLLQRSGIVVTPAAPRVAVEQRRPLGLFGGVFVSNTDPTNIDLAGPNDANTGAPTGNDQLAWITIAPDWEGLAPGTQFALVAGNKRGAKRTIAITPWARVLPATILAAAGLPPSSMSTRTVDLTYEARDRGRVTSVPVTLTFGPSDGTTMGAQAPVVNSVVRSDRLRVSYDLTNVRNATTPLIVVSSPGRVNPITGYVFHPTYVHALPNLKGTIEVPVSALQGDGVYGVTIGLRPDPYGGTDISDFAYTHVLRATHNDTPPAPLVSSGTSTPGHYVEIPMTGSFTVSWDVSTIPGANGALLEVSAPGPNGLYDYNTFNNPGGTIRDRNGVDYGSVYATNVSGTRGSVTLDAKRIGMTTSFIHTVRVIPLVGVQPAGEASAVSTVAYDGIAPLDGGYVNLGFAVNATGNDGFLTSEQVTAQHTFLGSLETFDQSTGVSQITESSSDQAYLSANAGIWGGDIGIVSTRVLGLKGRSADGTTFHLMNPVAANAITAPWQPPVFGDHVSKLVQTAPNADSAIALTLTGDPAGFGTSPYQVFTSNLLANTFGPAYNINSALPAGTHPFALSLAQDTKTNTAVVGFAAFDTECSAPNFASVDMSDGKIATFKGIGTGFPLDAAIDTSTQKLAYQTSCDAGLNIIDAGTHTGIHVTLPGQSGLFNAVDPMHHLIVSEMASDDGPGGNNNAMSALYVYDENGDLLKKLDDFNLYDTGLPVNANDLQLNFKTRTGYIFGPLASQIEVFTY